jgi:hypothetical protein
MLAPIGQRHAQQPLVHVLGRAVSRPMRAMDFATRSDGHKGGTGAAPHPDSVRSYPGGSAVVARPKGVWLSTVARYSYQVRPRRSVNSIGPVTSKVPRMGTSGTLAMRSCRRNSVLSKALARSKFSYGSTAVAKNVDTTVRVADSTGQDTVPSRNVTRPGDCLRRVRCAVGSCAGGGVPLRCGKQVLPTHGAGRSASVRAGRGT